MITLRPATLADIPAILEIYNDAALKTTATADTEPATLAQRTEWFDFRTANGYPILVSLDESEIVTGWSSLSPYHLRYGYRFTAEVSVYIAEKSRGKGIGKALLNALLEATDPLKFHSLVASIDPEKVNLFRFELYGLSAAGTVHKIAVNTDTRACRHMLQQFLLNGTRLDHDLQIRKRRAVIELQKRDAF